MIALNSVRSRVGVDGVHFAPHRTSRSFEVRFDGRRVWSDTIEARHRFVRWPDPLMRHTSGIIEVELSLGVPSEVVWSGAIVFGDDPTDAMHRGFADDEGRALVLSKWGRAVHSLDQDPEFADRLMRSLVILIDDLRAAGVRPFITGGTLLGAIRAGSFLPHDDDADLGYVSEASHPSDVVLESLALARTLDRLGYRVRTHSRSHLQVLFSGDASGAAEHYVDLFPGFIRDGLYCQPIAVRTPVAGLEIEPLSTLDLNGVPVPSVADPDEWLARCYGDDWRTPDPAFRFETPGTTRRRFENWFGVFNANREFWEELHVDTAEPIDERLLELLGERWDATTSIIDLGCGAGANARSLAAAGREVIAVDFSRPAMAQARAADSTHAVEWVDSNLADFRELSAFVVRMSRRRRDWRVSMSHLLEGLVPETRAQVLSSVELLIRGGGEAVATIGTKLPADYRHEDPRTWHLGLAELENEARAANLHVEVLAEHDWVSPTGTLRSEATVVLTSVKGASSA